MALPVNTTPIYTVEIPSTKKEFKYRPFLVKEEKALMIAQQSEDTGIMLDTVKEVIKACAKTNIDVDKLASFDIEYLFLQLRASSIGEMVELRFRCDVDHGEKNEEAIADTNLNILEAKVEFPEGHTNKFPLFGEVGMVLKYPTLNTLKKIETVAENDNNAIFDITAECVDYIYDGDQLFYAKDQKREELVEFLNNLTSQQFNQVQSFFQTMPRLRLYIKYTCPVCGLEHNKYMEGLSSFF